MNILEQAQKLGQAILETPEYQRFATAQKAQIEDEEATRQIQNYNDLRRNFALQIQNTNPPEEEIQKIRATLQEEFHKLRQNPIINEYIEANEEYSQLVENINGIINMYALGKEGGSCSGGCSSCSGCN